MQVLKFTFSDIICSVLFHKDCSLSPEMNAACLKIEEQCLWNINVNIKCGKKSILRLVYFWSFAEHSFMSMILEYIFELYFVWPYYIFSFAWKYLDRYFVSFFTLFFSTSLSPALSFPLLFMFNSILSCPTLYFYLTVLFCTQETSTSMCSFSFFVCFASMVMHITVFRRALHQHEMKHTICFSISVYNLSFLCAY